MTPSSSFYRKYPNEPTAYIWSPNIITKFESLWSIFQKFTHLNYCRLIDVRRIFEADLVTCKSSYNGLLSRSAQFNTIAPFDPLRLENILGLSSDVVKHSVNEPYTFQLKFQHSDYKYIINDVIRFCPICIKKGFHSPIHQLTFLKQCPIHDVDLLRSCPNCHLPIGSYTLKSNDFKNQYSCTYCGYKLFNIDDIDIYKPSLSNIDVNKIDNYIKWNCKIKTKDFYNYSSHGLTTYPMSRRFIGLDYGGCNEAPFLWAKVFHEKGLKVSAFYRDKRKVKFHSACGFKIKHTKVMKSKCLPFIPLFGKYVEDKETENFIRFIQKHQHDYLCIYKSIHRHIKKKLFKYIQYLNINDCEALESENNQQYFEARRSVFALKAFELFWAGYSPSLYSHDYGSNRSWMMSLTYALFHYPVLEDIFDEFKSGINKACTKERDTLLYWYSTHLFSRIVLQNYREAYDANIREQPYDIGGSDVLRIIKCKYHPHGFSSGELVEFKGKYNPYFILEQDADSKRFCLDELALPVLSKMNCNFVPL